MTRHAGRLFDSNHPEDRTLAPLADRGRRDAESSRKGYWPPGFRDSVFQRFGVHSKELITPYGSMQVANGWISANRCLQSAA